MVPNCTVFECHFPTHTFNFICLLKFARGTCSIDDLAFSVFDYKLNLGVMNGKCSYH
ncbi:hypothetical protein COLO4_03938 [Corchorus olitorius]|uniref:Uncharacterized protein n=1 Tax=Corchorus olitorius TaxID=93759 RepID=A0A1R3KW03_9ROSI|nr:hypothetical protein COLO4_03938 [Corchorus olitorius]